MSDWYTEDVRKALKIVPVEWVGLDGNPMRLSPGGLCVQRRRRETLGWFYLWDTTGHEARALIEKALREHMERKGVIWHYCDGYWFEDDPQERDFGTFLDMAAAAVLATKEGESAVDVYDASSGEYEGTISLPRGQKPEGKS